MAISYCNILLFFLRNTHFESQLNRRLIDSSLKCNDGVWHIGLSLPSPTYLGPTSHLSTVNVVFMELTSHEHPTILKANLPLPLNSCYTPSLTIQQRALACLALPTRQSLFLFFPHSDFFPTATHAMNIVIYINKNTHHQDRITWYVVVLICI